MKKLFNDLNKYPAYIGFIGAIIGVILGGLISFISLHYTKKIEIKENKRKHIEELYANFCYSFSIFKDIVITNYLNEWDMHISEKIFSYSKTPEVHSDFYKKRFIDKHDNEYSNNIKLIESSANFKKDYKLLKLYINLNEYDDYFNLKIDSGFYHKLILLKGIPQFEIVKFSLYQTDSLYSILDKEIENLHKKSDSLLSLIHQQVLIETGNDK